MNKYIKYLLIGSYLWVFGEGLFGPLYAVFAQRIGGDILELAFAYSLYLIVAGVITILIGRYSDVFGKGSIMVAGYALNTIATFGYLLVDSPAKLFVIQGLLGVALALSNPTWAAIFSKHLDKKRAGEQWGFEDGGNNIAMGVAVLIGGVIVTFVNFNVLFIIMGTIQLIATITQLIFLKVKA